MNSSRLIPLLAAVSLAASAAPASAAPAPNILQSGRNLRSTATASDVYTDRAGGVDAVWGVGDSRLGHLRFARRAKGHRAFGKAVALNRPHGVDGMTAAHLYEHAGELRILFDGSENSIPNEWVARSKNHGKSWKIKKLPGIAGGVFTSSPNSYGFFNRDLVAVGADGSLRGVFGDNGAESLYSVNAALTSGSMVTPFVSGGTGAENVARDGSAVWVTGRTDGGIAYRLPGGKNGIAPFGTTCAGQTTIANADSLAVAHGRAVLIASFCGKLLTRTLTAGGKLGGLHKLGTVNTALRSTSATHAGGRYRVAWAGADGDIREASSANGTTWKVAKGAIPAAGGSPDQTAGVYLDNHRGSWVTWLAGGSETDFSRAGYAAASSASRVSTPRVSARGIAHAKKGHLGTLALAGPGRVSLRSAVKGRSITIRLSDSARDTVFLNVTVQVSNVIFGFGNAVTVHLRPGHPRVIHVKADPRAAATYFRRGQKIGFDVRSRNGDVTVASAKFVR